MSGTSAKTSSTVEIVNITPRRRWSVGEKVRLIEASMAPGQSVSLVARTYGVAPNLLYRWRKQMSEGGKTAIETNDEVVSVAEVKALKKRIRQLERVLGNKKEAVRIGREKNLSRGCPCPAWRISSETGYGRPDGVDPTPMSVAAACALAQNDTAKRKMRSFCR